MCHGCSSIGCSEPRWQASPRPSGWLRFGCSTLHRSRRQNSSGSFGMRQPNRQTALERLGESRNLWIGPLQVEGAAESVHSISLVPWRTGTGKLAKWSGLSEDGQAEDTPVPVLVLDPEADKNGNYSKLEVRWKVRPENLEKGAVQYRVSVLTDLDEELTSREIPHSSKKEENCRFQQR